jgi:hypothetical protein
VAGHNDRVRTIAALAVVALAVAGVVFLGRRLASQGAGEVVVRCRDGHLFTTIWVPGVSLKAIRLGWIRMQRCPVGDHLTLVTPVRYSDLTDAERWAAARYRDGPLP